ncbi:MAG: TSUP family transporter, partial [Candidatus Nanopelagicales bacterium]
MTGLILIALAGFGASFIDGALGMGFGVTSTTLLLAVGLSPALASASVHLAKLGTAAASGMAHHRFGNVDWAGV